MIRILAITKELNPVYDLKLEELNREDLLWYWVDFDNPIGEENLLLDSFFHFHHLAIDACIYSMNSPKLDFYGEYNYFILNSLDKATLNPKEVSLFVGNNYIVSYHGEVSSEIDESWERVKGNKTHWDKGPTYVAHQIVDKIVDRFFPAAVEIEERLSKLETNAEDKSIHELIDEVFNIRKDLLKLRKIVNSMRDLLYRILNSERLHGFEDHNMYFSDIHDHLLKLSVMVESSREMTADMRDSYLSINSAHMNKNMMVLTVITTIFIPLTFIVGVYGMNFQHMPELETQYGYFIIMGIMVALGIGMFAWFKKKGWFDA
jgi:magnesium transporter